MRWLVVCLGVVVAISASAGSYEMSAFAALGSSFLESEAGITVYTKLNPVNLVQAERALKYVEQRTDQYVIGSLSLPGYDESHDVHVYVDALGWVAVYYLAQEPVSKIVDWRDYSSSGITSTKLEDGLLLVTDALHQGLPYIQYYDFRYPDATSLSIITDEEVANGSSNFRLLIPCSYIVYSRTWSHMMYNGFSGIGYPAYGSRILVDGTELNSWEGYYGGFGIWDGNITPTQLECGVWHDVRVTNWRVDGDYQWSGVAIVLVYSE